MYNTIEEYHEYIIKRVKELEEKLESSHIREDKLLASIEHIYLITQRFGDEYSSEKIRLINKYIYDNIYHVAGL